MYQGLRDVGLEQIRAGMAWWYREYAKEQATQERLVYRDEEEAAKAARRGAGGQTRSRRGSDRAMIQITWNDEDLDRPPTDEDWDVLELTSILYYLHETNPDNGLVRDKTEPTAPVSIAAVGMALATIPVVVERGVIIREFAAKITRKRLRFLHDCPQGPEPDASGYKGFFYHFLDIETGRRVWQCELSTIDSAFLFAGALTVADLLRRRHGRRSRDSPPGRRPLSPGRLELGPRRRADVDAWLAARKAASFRTAGKATTRACCSTSSASARRPIRCRPRALPPTARPISGRRSTVASCSIRARCSLTSSRTCGSTFAACATHFMREHGSDYFENSRQATFVQQEYAIRNPMKFAGYGEHCWGFTACDGPGWVKRVVNGVEREFFDYIARGAPSGRTTAPSLRGSSWPRCHSRRRSSSRRSAILPGWTSGMTRLYGFKPSFNQTFAVEDSPDRLVGHRRITSESIRGRSC